MWRGNTELWKKLLHRTLTKFLEISKSVVRIQEMNHNLTALIKKQLMY